jgi:hypothetical protein
MEGRFGLDAGGDLRTKPLETGEKRHATYETVHYALPYDAMQKSGTVFIICTLDGKDKEITAQHTFQSEKQEISHDLSTSTRPGNG